MAVRRPQHQHQTASTGQLTSPLHAGRLLPTIRQNSWFNYEHHGKHCAQRQSHTHRHTSSIFILEHGIPRLYFFAAFSYNTVFRHRDFVGTLSPLRSWHPQQGLLQHKHSVRPRVTLAFGTTASTIWDPLEGFATP